MMTPRIKEAIDIFLDAINNGTLAKGTCRACAVGNLVAHGMSGNITKQTRYDVFTNSTYDGFSCDVYNQMWSFLFSTSPDGCQEISRNQLVHDDVRKNIEATKFTWQELAKIEYAFENNTCLSFTAYRLFTLQEVRADQIKGLEAVVKVMLEFDKVQEDVEEVFTRKAELIPV